MGLTGDAWPFLLVLDAEQAQKFPAAQKKLRNNSGRVLFELLYQYASQNSFPSGFQLKAGWYNNNFNKEAAYVVGSVICYLVCSFTFSLVTAAASVVMVMLLLPHPFPS